MAKKNGGDGPTIGSAVKDLERAKYDAAEIAATVSTSIADLNRIKAELLDGIEADQKEHAERVEKVEREIREDISNLRSDILAKDAKVKDIQSKFSFVLGTVTERSEVR